jgi:hypothetical protein
VLDSIRTVPSLIFKNAFTKPLSVKHLTDYCTLAVVLGDKTITTSIKAARAASSAISEIASAYSTYEDYVGANVIGRVTGEAETITFELEDLATLLERGELD